VRSEEAGRGRLAHEVVVEAEHDVGLGRRALELQLGKESAGILARGIAHDASATRLERLLQGLAGTILPDEALIRVDGQRGLLLRSERQGG
jgi:hypothetical protein